MGVDLQDPGLGRFDLGFADPAGAVDHLALQVAVVHHVEIDDAQAPYPGSSQIKQQGRAEAAGANAEHRSRLEALLALHAHLGQDQVPGKASHLIGAQADATGIGGKHGRFQLQVPTLPNARPRSVAGGPDRSRRKSAPNPQGDRGLLFKADVQG